MGWFEVNRFIHWPVTLHGHTAGFRSRSRFRFRFRSESLMDPDRKTRVFFRLMDSVMVCESADRRLSERQWLLRNKVRARTAVQWHSASVWTKSCRTELKTLESVSQRHQELIQVWRSGCENWLWCETGSSWTLTATYCLSDETSGLNSISRPIDRSLLKDTQLGCGSGPGCFVWIKLL